MRKILVTVAHPDDEAFGPGGTIAKYCAQGVQIHLLFATKGEAGENYLKKTRSLALPKLREREARNQPKYWG